MTEQTADRVKEERDIKTPKIILRKVYNSLNIQFLR